MVVSFFRFSRAVLHNVSRINWPVFPRNDAVHNIKLRKIIAELHAVHTTVQPTFKCYIVWAFL